MAEKVHKCDVKREPGFLYYIDARGNVGRFRIGSKSKEIVCPNGGEFTKEPGWMYFLDKDGDVSRSKMKSFKEFIEIEDSLIVESDWTDNQLRVWTSILSRLGEGQSKRTAKGLITRGYKAKDARFADLSQSYRIDDGDWMTLERAAETLASKQ